MNCNFHSRPVLRIMGIRGMEGGVWKGPYDATDEAARCPHGPQGLPFLSRSRLFVAGTEINA